MKTETSNFVLFAEDVVYPPFSPLIYDETKLVEIWDGQNFVDPTWSASISTPDNDIICANIPTTGIVNDLRTIIFNGINQSGNSTVPVIAQPYTIYLVFKQITWTNNDYIFDDGIISFRIQLTQEPLTPSIRLYEDNGAINIDTNELAVNTWGIVTVVMAGSNSGLRVDLNSMRHADMGLLSQNGINVASSSLGTGFGNIEFAYIIVRSAADPTSVQNLFINWLKTRFGI